MVAQAFDSAGEQMLDLRAIHAPLADQPAPMGLKLLYAADVDLSEAMDGEAVDILANVCSQSQGGQASVGEVQQ
jgi:hypothetical protein